MAFENIETWGMAWGYIFVIVIAGLALLVGKKKRDRSNAKKEAESKAESTPKPAETSPELEQVDPKSESNQADGKESEKTE